MVDKISNLYTTCMACRGSFMGVIIERPFHAFRASLVKTLHSQSRDGHLHCMRLHVTAEDRAGTVSFATSLTPKCQGM